MECWRENNMAAETTEVNEKENLADFIKSVHSNLRKEVQKANGDYDSVWQKHCQDSPLLQQYSQSMKELAVEHWGGNNLRRIEWCKEACVEYFYQGGYEKCLRKDCRRVLLNLDQHQNCTCASDAESLMQKLSRDDYQARSDKIVLLDVGSCFNPFQEFPETFIPVAIDLCPADQSVFSCDFLAVEIITHDTICSQNDPTPTSSSIRGNHYFPAQIQRCIDSHKLAKLPASSLDVVVFCLLLSYLPAKQQRWSCCLKARQLLKQNGLLVIITPDSSHQNKNMSMIKSWKTAIESIGFLRWKYHKDDHTHCMAFRKRDVCGSFTGTTREVLTSPEEMLYIHQDLQDSLEEEGSKCKQGFEEDTQCVVEGFHGLPFAGI